LKQSAWIEVPDFARSAAISVALRARSSLALRLVLDLSASVVSLDEGRSGLIRADQPV
jgi:hypothetical protein